MVPSGSTRNQGLAGSGGLPVFVATVVWCVVLCLMAWLVQLRTGSGMRAWPPSPALGLWALAPVTLVLGWLARHHHKHGYFLLGTSLLLATWLFVAAG